MFFTTSQQLVNGDTDTTSDLYEYDFDKPAGQRLIQISGGGAGDLTPGAGAERWGYREHLGRRLARVFRRRRDLTTLPNGVGRTRDPGGAEPVWV